MLGALLNRTRMALVLTATMETAKAAIGGVRSSSDANHVIVPKSRGGRLVEPVLCAPFESDAWTESEPRWC